MESCRAPVQREGPEYDVVTGCGVELIILRGVEGSSKICQDLVAGMKRQGGCGHGGIYCPGARWR